MRSGAGIVRVAWVLLGLLAIGSVAFELGQPVTREQPYAASFDPSGSAALVELLRQDGYRVQIETTLPASLRPGILAIAFVERSGIGLPLTSPSDEEASSASAKKSASGASGDEVDNVFNRQPRFAPPAVRLVVSYLRAGGKALVLGYDPRLDLRVEHPVGASVVDPAHHTYKVALPSGIESNAVDLTDVDAGFPAWMGESQPFANLDQLGTGRAVIVGSGEVAMNSYIDQGDNARLLLDQIHLLAPKRTQVEVLDGSISGAAGGLIEVLGPWAHGAQLQLILVGLVIVYALGKRFGLADETVRAQRGARELLDGIADTYNRGRAAKAGLQALLQDGDRAVRRQLKLASDAPLRKRNEMLPPALAQALTACEHALMQDPTPAGALTLARRLDTELELFIRYRKPTAKRARRRVNSV